MPLAVFLFYTPLLIIAEGGFYSCFLCVHPHLAHNKREFSQVDHADPFQIVHAPKPPVLIFLFRQNANFHQHVHRSCIPPPLALAIDSRMYFSNQFFVIYFRVPLQDTVFDFWNALSPALNTEQFLLPSILLMLWTGWKLLLYNQVQMPAPKWKDFRFPPK